MGLLFVGLWFHVFLQSRFVHEVHIGSSGKGPSAKSGSLPFRAEMAGLLRWCSCREELAQLDIRKLPSILSDQVPEHHTIKPPDSYCDMQRTCVRW